MDVDDDDDFYGAEEGAQAQAETAPAPQTVPEKAIEPTLKSEKEDEDLEEGEEEDEDESSDSDIDIITERKDGAPPPAIYNKPLPQRNPTAESIAKSVVSKKETPPKEPPPPSKTSKIDVNAKPIYPPAGKPITQVNIDEDLPDSDKPWRRAGADLSDYFNYGFDEFTWLLYAQKQELESQSSKKALDDMSMMFGGGMAMPGMPSGADAMNPEIMQQMMQQMMASGMDPSQMDPSMFGGAGGTAQAGNQGYGAQAGYGGQGQNTYGYDQSGAGNNRGNFRGRGGRRGGW